MEFQFQADTKFEAKNLDDACEKIASHFKAIKDDKQENTPWFVGEMHLEPVKSK